MYTMDELKAMSPDELQIAHRRLAKRALGNFLMLMLVKWLLIFGITRGLTWLLTRSEENNRSSK